MSIKRIIAVSLLLVTTLLLAACSKTPIDIVPKTVPVYQSMVASNIDNTQTSFRNKKVYKSFSRNEDIKETFQPIESETVDFVVNPNQDFLITIKLENPDAFTILRFELNGWAYLSYQLEAESDHEHLVLKLNSGENPGIISFKIDQIKYIDDIKNNTIKDVIISGNQTITGGVTFDTIPTVLVSEQRVGASKLSLTVEVEDVYGLFEKIEKSLYIFIFKDDVIIQKQVLNESTTTIKIDNLEPLTDYIYTIAGIYDALDDLGPRIDTFVEAPFTTIRSIEINEASFYISRDEVAMYIATFNKLPANYMTKAQAGGKINSFWTPETMASIGGDNFQNKERLLPTAPGRTFIEVDINYQGGGRGRERIVYSNDGLIFYTGDHYSSFVLFDEVTLEWTSY